MANSGAWPLRESAVSAGIDRLPDSDKGEIRKARPRGCAGRWTKIKTNGSIGFRNPFVAGLACHQVEHFLVDHGTIFERL
jgi:hypothetical protein